ncbi:MAG: ABC transporter ATP-binding protein [Pyrinomonadaceae bacterium]|nr:ABC transporter ATP-binding protein [Pyrinomonadaceae bacterium]
MKAIEVVNLVKTYGAGETAVHALKGVDLDVFESELLLLLGASGSGKTTLISIVGGILSATSGNCVIRGREIVGLPQSKLPKIRLENIGFIFQGFNLFPALTTQENVEIALDLKGVRGGKAKKRAAELLERVGLKEKLKTFPADLSGGQKQRVAIARALAGEPPIILADEPTAALDSESGRLIMDLLQELAHEQNRAIVVVTHDNRIFDYADRIVKIEDGRISKDESNEQTDAATWMAVPSASVNIPQTA